MKNIVVDDVIEFFLEESGWYFAEYYYNLSEKDKEDFDQRLLDIILNASYKQLSIGRYIS